jgi:cyclophilin family peptidyl-prolyl cis-trans isomerase
MSTLVITTDLGVIRAAFRPDAAPVTAAYIAKVARSGTYDGTSFYRSDFVIQCGLHGSANVNPHGNLPVNETAIGRVLSNTRGTCAIAHWDVPDCGNTEFFINLQPNPHLDEAYGGYCVFAEVEDAASFAVVDKIAAIVPTGTNPRIVSMAVE